MTKKAFNKIWDSVYIFLATFLPILGMKLFKELLISKNLLLIFIAIKSSLKAFKLLEYLKLCCQTLITLLFELL